MLWIPTAFVFWILYLFYGALNLGKMNVSTNKQLLFQEYDKLTERQKQLGREIVIKIFSPLSYSLAVIYAVSIAILVLAKSGIIASNDFSIVKPLIGSLLLLIILIGGLNLYKKLGVNDVSELRKLLNKNMSTKKILLIGVVVLIALVTFAGFYFALPLWALIASWRLYYTGAMLYKIMIVLVLQVLAFFLLIGYLTQQSAKTELSNYSSSLSDIKLRINQLLSLKEIPVTEIEMLKASYFKAIKYRYQRELLIGFVPAYSPRLNTAFINSDNKS
jgi:hypothetical protein